MRIFEITVAGKPLDVLRLAGVREAFSESDIPFKVDIIDWATTDGSFRCNISRDYKVLQRPEKGWSAWGVKARGVLFSLVENLKSG